jgi:metallo-beta-lactamase class B
MRRKITSILSYSILTALLSGFLAAQAQDSAAVNQHIEKAKKIASAEWAQAEQFFCQPEPYANKPDDPRIPPTKIFDNVYAMGRRGTVVYAITTSDGIILIDSGYADQLDSVLLPDMQKLGLDPAKVKYILLGHGHGDHFGGARYFQEHYGTHVVLSAADWDLLQPKPDAAKKASKNGPPVDPPDRDIVAAEGQAITLGDEKVTPVSIPGHTPGSLGFIFTVKDGGKTHIAGLYGGTVLIPRMAWNLEEYLSSLDHWAQMTRQMKVDTELQNHPLMDGIDERLAKIQARKPGDPNPFVVGQAAYQRFVSVISECTKAQMVRLGKMDH